MSVVSLEDRRVLSDRRAVARTAPAARPVVDGLPSRRRIWTGLLLYCTAFWALVAYASFEAFVR